MTPKPTVPVRTSDGDLFTLSHEAASLSNFIGGFLEDAGDQPLPEPLTLNEVNSAAMKKIALYMEHHAGKPVPEIEKPLSGDLKTIVGDWDFEFAEMSDEEMLVVINAANYLFIPGLIDLLCAKIATTIVGKTVEQIRERHHIENDLTPEEEQRIRQEYAWALQ